MAPELWFAAILPLGPSRPPAELQGERFQLSPQSVPVRLVRRRDVTDDPRAPFGTPQSRLLFASVRHPVRAVVDDPAETRKQKIAAAAYLVGATRNQVQHQVDTTMVIVTVRSAAVFTPAAPLSLRRLNLWVA